MSNEPTFSEFAKRLRPLVEERRRLSADMRELMKEMREIGIEGGVMKAWLEALVEYEDTGKDTRIKRLQERTTNAAIYAEALGLAIDGFGDTTRCVVNNSTQAAPDTPPQAPQAPGSGVEDFEDIPPYLRRQPKEEKAA